MYARLVARLPPHLKGFRRRQRRVSRAELAAHQRDRVLESRDPVFARRGYQATTVDDLLAAGKVGVGNFYSLFEGKEDCFLAPFDWLSASPRTSRDRPRRRELARGAFLGLREMLVSLCAEPGRPASSWSRRRPPDPWRAALRSTARRGPAFLQRPGGARTRGARRSVEKTARRSRLLPPAVPAGRPPPEPESSSPKSPRPARADRRREELRRLRGPPIA